MKDLLSTNADYSQVTCKVHVHCLLLTFVEARQEQTHVVKYLMLHIALRYIYYPAHQNQTTVNLKLNTSFKYVFAEY